MTNYLIKYYQGRTRYEDWQNKLRLLSYEDRKFAYEIGVYKPFKIVRN